MNKQKDSGRGLLGSLALLAALWGVLGWLDLDQQAQAGFDTDGNNHVTQVYPGSAAERAGLQVGDRLVSIAGYAAEDARSLSRLPRMKVGDQRVFTVQRDQAPLTEPGDDEMPAGSETVASGAAGNEQGGSLDIAIMYAPLSERSLALEHASVIIGFCFLLFPLLALFRASSNASRLLAVMGIGLSLAFFDGPYISEASMRALVSTITALFIFFGIASLLQFLLVFPNRRPFVDKGYARTVLYLPAMLLWALVAWRLLLTPAASSGLNTLTGLMLGLVIGGYFLVSLFRILRNYSQTDQSQRKALGLNLMLWGTIIGLLPVTIGQLAAAFSPQSVLPGQDYYFISLALIPLTWARSASRLT